MSFLCKPPVASHLHSLKAKGFALGLRDLEWPWPFQSFLLHLRQPFPQTSHSAPIPVVTTVLLEEAYSSALHLQFFLQIIFFQKFAWLTIRSSCCSKPSLSKRPCPSVWTPWSSASAPAVSNCKEISNVELCKISRIFLFVVFCCYVLRASNGKLLYHISEGGVLLSSAHCCIYITNSFLF